MASSIHPRLREFFSEGATVDYMGGDASERAYGHLAAQAAMDAPVRVRVTDNVGPMLLEIELQAAYATDPAIARENLGIFGVPQRDMGAIIAQGARVDLTELPAIAREQSLDNERNFRM